MFDLEQAISRWRQQMLAAGITPTTIEELESHLREEIMRQMKLGVAGENAFAFAARQIGRAPELKQEFKKTSLTATIFEIVRLVIGGGFFCLILFLCTCTVIMCFSSFADRLVASCSMAVTLLLAGGWKYMIAFLPVIQSRRNRWLIGLACIASGFLVSTLFCALVLPYFEVRDNEHHIPAIGFLAAFWVALFSSLGVGLLLNEQGREALGRKKKTSAPTLPANT